jgi:hypothetical protein
MKTRIKPEIALFTLLALAVAVVVLPILGNLPLNGDEKHILDHIIKMRTADLGSVLSSSNDIFFSAYAYVVNLIAKFTTIDIAVILRLPGAVAAMILTLCLFHYNRTGDKTDTSFLASLLFLSCGLTMRFTFQASPIIIPAALFIFALMSGYRLACNSTKRHFWIAVFASACSTVFIGVTSPIICVMMIIVLMASNSGYSAKNYVGTVISQILGIAAAFIGIYIITGNRDIADSIFNVSRQLDALGLRNSMINVFASYLIFAVFPWSIPLIISAFWFFKHINKVWHKFLTLGTLQQFGIVIFLFTLPSMFFETRFSLILIVTSMFFNMPLIGKYLLYQFDRHPSVWRITGGIAATIVALGVVAFIVLKSAASITIGSISIALAHGLDFWSVLVLVCIFISLYSLWRNKREIRNNHRYLYNIVVLYFLSAVLTIGYIIQKVAITSL